MNFLNWLLGRREKQAAPPPPAPVLETLKANIARLQKLPTLPHAASQALVVAKDPGVSLERLAGVIERDPALTASILRLANSALYRTYREVRAIHQAVVKIGIRECYNLILTVSMRSLFRHVLASEKMRYDLLWEHSFMTACLCRSLNERFRLGFRGEEFTCGVTHDIGRVLIAIGAPDIFQQIDPVDFDEGPDLLERETAVLGTDHCMLGAWFAVENQLPAAVAESAEYHHRPLEAPESPLLVALVAVADDMANHYQRCKTIEGYKSASCAAWQVLQKQIRTDDGDFDEIAGWALRTVTEELMNENSPAAL